MTSAEIAALEAATPTSLPSSSSPSPSFPALAQLHLPKPNEFIPSDFTLVTPAVGSGGGSEGGGAGGLLPFPLREEEGGNRRLWYKHDNVFKQPKLFYQCLLVSPVVSESPESVVCAEILTRLVTDKLTEYSYNAALAGRGGGREGGREGRRKERKLLAWTHLILGLRSLTFSPSLLPSFPPSLLPRPSLCPLLTGPPILPHRIRAGLQPQAAPPD